VEVINLGPDLALNLQLGFSPHLIPSTFRFHIGTKLSKGLLRHELWQWPCMCKLSESFEIASILVHWNLNNPAEDGKNPVVGFQAIFKLEILVPERVSKEV
jgi:hypothetical protein